jgi:phenylacetate-CoA ligase
MVINMTELPLGGNKDNSIENLRRQQFILLQKQLERVYENSSFYRAKLNGAGLAPSDIQSMTDLTKIPLTTREELEKNFIDILAVSTSNIATIRMSSGTTGSPLKIAHTKNDVNMIADASARRLTYHGATDKDVVQITSAYGLWQGAWSMHWGAEKIGACVLPIGPADTERQLLLIKQHGTTILYGATNYHFRILEVAKSLGEDLTKYNLKMAICVAEKPTAAQIDLLKSNAGYQKVISDYGATEFPGFSVNCKVDGERHHVWADYYLVEVVDPATHEPLQEGQKGELVITSLQREAFPLIRYLSRDITTYFGFENCACGLNHPMISANIDREDSMTKIRGVTVFPSHIEKILNNFPGITAKCQLIVDKHTPRHETIIKVETAQSLSPEQEKSLKAGIISEVKTRVGIGLNDVIFIPQNELGNKFKKVVILE